MWLSNTTVIVLVGSSKFTLCHEAESEHQGVMSPLIAGDVVAAAGCEVIIHSS